MNLFSYIDFETISTCNRRCPTCIRNSHPDREAVKSWFERNLFPIDLIREALDQCVRLDFKGGVCLSHYNEPLMDERLPEIAELAKAYGRFFVFLNTNGDLINEQMARDLDGRLDRMIISLYMDEPIKSQRAEWLQSLFQKTELHIITQSDHMATHFSPKFDVALMASKYINNACLQPGVRLILNHRRQFLVCCDDVVGNFGFDRKFPDMSLEEFWFGEKYGKIKDDLSQSGGRRNYPYCRTCPRE